MWHLPWSARGGKPTSSPVVNAKRYRLYFLWSAVFAILLSGCQSSSFLPTIFLERSGLTNELPEQLLYLVTTSAEKSELIVFDGHTLKEINRTNLLPTNIWHLNRDPMGRIWIGYAGSPTFSTNQVDVFHPDGRPFKTLNPCSAPYSGIHFAANRAFIPCAENGFHAKVTVVDLSSLEIIKSFDVKDFFLLAAASDEDTVVILGGSSSHASIVFIDPYALEITSILPLDGGVNVRTIIPHDRKFYLLSSGSFRHPADTPIDLRIVKPGDPPTVLERKLAVRSPLWGIIADNQLYAYHNPTYTTTNRDPARFMSRFDLDTGETEVWSLPDYWDARDLVWADGRILLTRSLTQDAEKAAGIYTFDARTGNLTQLLYIPRAKQILYATVTH